MAGIGEGSLVEARYEFQHVPTFARANIVRHWVCTGSDTASVNIYDSLIVFATQVYNAMNANFGELLSNDVNLMMVRAKVIGPTESVHASLSITTGFGFVSDVDEFDDAAVICLRTHLGGRRRRGRVYLPGLPDTQTSNGILAPSYAAEVATAAAACWVTGIEIGSSGQYYPIVFSRQHLVDNPAGWANSFALIQAVEVDQIVRRMTTRDIKGRVPIGPP